MGLTDLKKELKTLDKDQLIALIADLYKKNKAAQEYLDFYVQPNERERFEKYRAKVVETFFPKRGYQLRLHEGKWALSDFQKLAPAAKLVADLLLNICGNGRAVHQRVRRHRRDFLYQPVKHVR